MTQAENPFSGGDSPLAWKARPRASRITIAQLRLLPALGNKAKPSSRATPDIPNSLTDSQWTNLGIGDHDHEAHEALLRESGLDWTCVRVAILTNRRSRGKLIVSYDGRPKPAMTIGRAEVAGFMVEILDQTASFGKAPIISEPPI